MILACTHRIGVGLDENTFGFEHANADVFSKSLTLNYIPSYIYCR